MAACASLLPVAQEVTQHLRLPLLGPTGQGYSPSNPHVDASAAADLHTWSPAAAAARAAARGRLCGRPLCATSATRASCQATHRQPPAVTLPGHLPTYTPKQQGLRDLLPPQQYQQYSSLMEQLRGVLWAKQAGWGWGHCSCACRPAEAAAVDVHTCAGSSGRGAAKRCGSCSVEAVISRWASS